MADKGLALSSSYRMRTPPTMRMFGQLSLGAAAGPALFTVAWMTLGGLRSRFSFISDPISGLGVGDYAVLMNTAFIFCGVATFVGVLGIFGVIGQRTGYRSGFRAAILAVSGWGVAIDGLFTFRSFLPHFVGFALGVGLPVIGFPLAGSLLRKSGLGACLRTWLFISGPLVLFLIALFFATFDPQKVSNGIGVAGLTERLLVLTLHGTFILFGLWAYATSRKAIVPDICEPLERQ